MGVVGAAVLAGEVVGRLCLVIRFEVDCYLLHVSATIRTFIASRIGETATIWRGMDASASV